MHNLLQLLTCLVCAGHGRRTQLQRSGDEAIEYSEKWRLNTLLPTLELGAAFNPGSAVAASGPVLTEKSKLQGRLVQDVGMTADPSRVKMLKLRAEKAALEAEKASLEAERLQLQATKMKLEKQGATAAAESSNGENVPDRDALQSAPPLDPAPNSALAPTPAVDTVKAAEPAQPAVSLRVPGAAWPEPKGKFHRFIKEDDPTFDKSAAYLCRTRSGFIGTKREGVYDGSFRIQFTLPGNDSDVKILELLQSREGNSSFGAVRMTALDLVTSLAAIGQEPAVGDAIQPVLMPKKEVEPAPWWNPFARDEVDSSNLFVVATKVKDGTTIMKDGDVLRAISPSVIPPDGIEGGGTQVFQIGFPMGGKPKAISDAELDEGMLIVDGKSPDTFYNFLLGGNLDGEVVLVIERPDNYTPAESDAVPPITVIR